MEAQVTVCLSEWWPLTKCKLIFDISFQHSCLCSFTWYLSFFLSMVAQKTSKLRYSDWLLRNFNQSESGYLSYHGEQNGEHHAKEHLKLSWKLVSKNSIHFVCSHHSEKQTVHSGTAIPGNEFNAAVIGTGVRKLHLIYGWMRWLLPVFACSKGGGKFTLVSTKVTSIASTS